jgi:hypothetical protein
VYVHGVLELVLEGLDFGFLVEEVFFLETDLGLQLVNAPDLFLNAHELVSLVGQIGSKIVELFLFLFIVYFSLRKIGVG